MACKTASVNQDMATYNQENTDGARFTKMTTHLQSGASLLFSLLSTVLMAFAGQFMVLSSQAGVPALQLIFLMKLVQLLCVLVVTPCFRPKLTGKDTKQTLVLLLVAITDNLGFILGFISVVYVVPGIAFGIIQGSMPFFTACFGCMVLKETVGVTDFSGILLSVLGVIVVGIGMGMADASSSYRLTAFILLPIGAGVIKGVNNVIQRWLIGVQGVSIMTAVLYVQMLGTVLLLQLTYSLGTPRWTMSAQTAGYVIGLCLGDAVASFSGKVVLILEKAGIYATLQAFVVPMTILLDYVFQSEFPGLVELIGVTLVVLGTAVVGGRTWWVHRQEIRHKQLSDRLSFDD